MSRSPFSLPRHRRACRRAGGAHAQTAGARATSTTNSRPSYDQAPAPGMPLAPRLQNLGVHTFPVDDEDRARAAVHQPGREPGLRRSTTPRPRARSPRPRGSIPSAAMAYWGHALVLGPNINAPMDAGGRAEGARAGAEGGRAEGEASRRASAPTSTRSPRATPARPRTAQQADRAYADAMRTVVAAYPERSRRADALRRSR